MTHAEQVRKVLQEFRASPDNYTQEELMNIFDDAKEIMSIAALQLVEYLRDKP